MGEEKTSTITEKDVSKIKNFDNWITGIINLEKYFISYFDNLKSLREYKKNKLEYYIANTLAIIFAFIVYICIGSELINKTFDLRTVLNFCLIEFDVIVLIVISTYWKKKITFNSGKFNNVAYKQMIYINDSPILSKSNINYVKIIVNLYSMSIIAMLYPEKIKNFSKSKEYELIKNHLDDDPDKISKKYHEIAGDNVDKVIEAYLHIRCVPSSLLLTLIENPRINLTIYRGAGYFNNIQTISTEIIDFFRKCCEKDDFECICEQNTFENDEFSEVLRFSPICIEALMDIVKMQLPEFSERLEKFAAKENSPFKDLYNEYLLMIKANDKSC